MAQRPVSEAVAVDGGQISGRTAAENAGLHVYFGIPYAAPPVGSLRWRPPQPVKSWEGLRAADKAGPACPQPQQTILGLILDPEENGEDCLYLNVWTPARYQGDRLPVMVWIHGGSYTTGSGSLAFYDGGNLARQGVVVVTINYRLGALGFLAHPLLSKESDKKVSGNYGLLDQIAALQWVRKNVAAFGGNPDNVTVFGESAGAMSITHLMVSPLAKGLFQRAISESAASLGQHRHLRESWYGLESAERVGERLAERLGCSTAPDPLAALRDKSADEILAAAKSSLGIGDPTAIAYWPIVDGWAVPDEPAVLFAAGKQHNVPLLLGTNANEGTAFLGEVPVKTVQGYQLLVRALFGAHADEVLQLFPATSGDTLPAVLDRLVTVSGFVTYARIMATGMDQIQGKAYLYHFTRVPPYARTLKLGATHAIEIPYVFDNLRSSAVLTLPSAVEERDHVLAKTVSAYWVRFASTGDPNREGLPEWPVYHSRDDRYLDLGDEVVAKQALFKAECDLFARISAERAATRR